MATLHFKNLSVPIDPDRTILDVLIEARAPITFLCIGGTCGTCKIRVARGQEFMIPRDQSEESHDLAANERLSCQAQCTGAGDVFIEQD